MAKVNIPSGTMPFHASGANTTYHLSANATIESETIGIDVDGAATGRIVEIDGSIEAKNFAVALGDETVSAPALELIIGKKGEIDGADAGVSSYGLGHVIRNNGQISGSSGVEAHGGIELVNTGDIYGFYAINIFGTGGGSSTIINSGTIMASYNGRAIHASGQVEKVINTGFMHGEVSLGSGDDIFIFKSGIVDGEVRGGYGNELYVVNKAGLNIVEEADQGTDSVRASVKFELPTYVENLTLTGGKNIDGIGNGGDNDLLGNSGENLLFGWYGNDFLDGGKGNDKLIGGFGNDEFHFQRGGGRDVVTDFEGGFDLLDLSAFKGAKGYDDMVKHHLDDKGDDLWITYGKDTVVLKNTDVDDLDAANFIIG